MFGAAPRALAISCSLALLAGLSWAQASGSYTEIQRELSARTDFESRRQLVLNRLKDDPAAKSMVRGLRSKEPSERLQAMNEARRFIAERAETEQRFVRPIAGSPADDARRIKANPLYTDRRSDKEQSNWLQTSLRRLLNMIPRLSSPDPPEVPPGAAPPNLSFLTWVAWTIIAVVVLVLLYFVLRHFQWKLGKRVRKLALVEDDEPDRTLDEWLALADQLEREGKYRECVRALYLACLMRMDQAGIVRFNRRQTNWEHLARIEAGGKLPAELDFREPTRRFDRVWYGFEVNPSEDPEAFRNLYARLLRILSEGKAA